jgi:hypothetical protein
LTSLDSVESFPGSRGSTGFVRTVPVRTMPSALPNCGAPADFQWGAMSGAFHCFEIVRVGLAAVLAYISDRGSGGFRERTVLGCFVYGILQSDEMLFK